MSKKTPTQHKPVTVEQLGLTPEQMTRFAGGARFLFGDGKQPNKSGPLSNIKKPSR